MYSHEIAFKNHDDGFMTARCLLDAGYVVLLSYEENLLILNYEWSERDAYRGDVVFMPRYEFDEKYCEYTDEF